MLTKLEENVLLTVLKLKNNAYIVTIKDQLENQVGKAISFGALYVSLNRLISYKFITSRVGESFSIRGGRAKKYYLITKSGIIALQEAKKLQDLMWQDFENLTGEIWETE